MTEMHLRYMGQGQFRAASRVDKDIADEMAAPGAVLVMRPSNKRSHPQNQRFHAIIEAAYDHCLDDRFPTWRHLKAYILCAVGHCDEYRIALHLVKPDGIPIIAGGIAEALRGQTHSVVTSYDAHSHELVIRAAKSVSFNSLGAARFGELSDKCVDYICIKICPGMQPEELKRHAKEVTRCPTHPAAN